MQLFWIFCDRNQILASSGIDNLYLVIQKVGTSGHPALGCNLVMVLLVQKKENQRTKNEIHYFPLCMF